MVRIIWHARGRKFAYDNAGYKEEALTTAQTTLNLAIKNGDDKLADFVRNWIEEQKKTGQNFTQ